MRVLMRAFLASYRLEVRGEEHLRRVRERGKAVIYAFFHGEQFVLIPFHRGRGIGLMVSLSRDGDAQARLLASLGYVPFRGSSSRRGAAALIGLINHMRKGFDGGMTVDGPRGPLHMVKPGVVTLAYKGGGAIVPLRVLAPRSWVLRKTWCKYMIPKPFSRVVLEYREPVELSGDLDADVAAVQEQLLAPIALVAAAPREA